MEEVPIISLLAYLVAAVLFIIGLMRMGTPKTARTGNIYAAIGMLIAIIVTLLLKEVLNYVGILIGMAIGGAIGGFFARKVQMTQMPQMVGIYNGFGGGASLLIALAVFFDLGQNMTLENSVTIVLTVLIGSITLSGSFIAFGKLQGFVSGRPITYPLQNIWNGIIFLAVLAGMVYLVAVPGNITVMLALVAVTLILGILLVIPIGGADMPVVISLLNSYSGIAGAAAGFVIGNMFLIISGALVGAAGFILTRSMCKAMNRSLGNVMFGAFGAVTATSGGGGAGADGDKSVREATQEDVGMLLGFAKSVIIVPGYGLATSQAQHLVAELGSMLEERGADVKYAIHPVAGRMPGHMNVLLAEANVPYDKLYDLDQVNNEFERADVAVVVGANDVVNPDANNMADSPLYGMPILNADKSKSVVVIKRSLSPGFAGVDNPLFYMDKTMMFFRDGKQAFVELIDEIKHMD
ncbi:MAG: NAD(P)(+) transhydrogenase (Re/Si-specific) subunit beta [Dehalococcoidales bacterium]|nr:NAD(P)(+) transhydrogenase (Re/Si-specific) subunit beta [Dehalococcoidales bacterium]